MGRSKIEIPEKVLTACIASGKTQKEIAKDLGISIPTLARCIADLRVEEGPLMQYRKLKGSCLTGHNFKALEAITPQKLHDASLSDLVKVYRKLDKINGNIFKNLDKGYSDIGLLHHLLSLE